MNGLLTQKPKHTNYNDCCDWILREGESVVRQMSYASPVTLTHAIWGFCRFGSLNPAETVKRQCTDSHLRHRRGRTSLHRRNIIGIRGKGKLDTAQEYINLVRGVVIEPRHLTFWFYFFFLLVFDIIREKIMKFFGVFFLLFVNVPTFVVMQKPLRENGKNVCSSV